MKQWEKKTNMVDNSKFGNEEEQSYKFGKVSLGKESSSS